MRPIAVILATALATATNHRENSTLKAGKRIAAAALLGFAGFSLCLAAADGPDLVSKQQADGIITHASEASDGASGGGSAGPVAGETWTNTLGMEFVGVPAGSFVMGRPIDEGGYRYNERQHEVRISEGFWMGRYEVTQGEWEAVMGTNPSFFIECGWRCPVERVGWYQVREFIRMLNERESGSGYTYRLPTEAEWEYAARAGTTGPHYGELDEIAWYEGNSGSTTHPVGEKRANAWGLHDMLGNVEEWTADSYGLYSLGAVTDPRGPDFDNRTIRNRRYRTTRGSSWYDSASRSSILPGVLPASPGIHVALRGREIPSDSANVVRDRGFRLVRSQGSGSVEPVEGERWENTLGMEFVGVPAGSFVTGSPDDEWGRFPNERQHEVRISRGFWMGKYEVTQGEWEAVMGANPSRFSECGTRCPVDSVSWEDVQEFIRELNERESGSGHTYRLPTEAEWEYAARAGTTGARLGHLVEIAWYEGNSDLTTHPGGEKLPNLWGLRDMLGNVWEWTGDWAGTYPSGSVTDPRGPDTGKERVSRGGSGSSVRRVIRHAYRAFVRPDYSSPWRGFRLVRTISSDAGPGGAGTKGAVESGASGDDTGSGGGSAGTATAIEVGSSLAGRIGAPGEVDRYRFEVSEATRVEVYTTGSRPMEMRGQLDSLETATGPYWCDDCDHRFRIEAWVAAGVHIVQVAALGYDGPETGDYVLHVRALGDYGAGDGDTGSGGGSAGTATAIEVGSSLAGRIGEYGGVDRYRFEVSEAARVEVYTTGKTDTFGWLDNSAANDDGGQGANFRIEAWVAAGVHIVQVSGHGFSTGDYVLHVRAPLDEFRCETCDTVADGFPVARLRQGEFSWLEARVIDPACDCPFPGNLIPRSRLASLPNGAWPEAVYERNVREGTFDEPGGDKVRLVAQGWTPLHEAVANGSSAHPRGWLNPARLDEVLAGWPLAIEAELRNLGSRSGWTPLHLAARRADPGIVKRLLVWLEHRPAVDARAFDGATPLLVAGTREVFEALRAAGAEVQARTDYGWTVLHSAARLRDMDAATVRSLVAAGLDPNAATDAGWTPLLVAGAREVFEALQAAEAEVQARADNGWTVLHSAVGLRDMDAATVRSLVAAGLDPNAATDVGWTPLLRAGTREVFAALLELGADRTGIEAAFAPGAFRDVRGGGEGALGAVQLSNSVRQVGRFGDAAWFERLRAVNPDFYAVPGNPGSADRIFPLHWAVRDNEDPAAVAALTGEASATVGWSVDVNLRSFMGWPLEIAARWNGNPAVVGALLEAGAVVAAGEGAALYAAALNEKPRAAEIVGALLEAGADVNGVEPADRRRARRPVYAAAMAKNLATLDALLEAGADVNVEGSAPGYSLLADVLSRGRFDCGYGPVAERLRSAGARAERGGGEAFAPGPQVAECMGTGSGTGGADTGHGGRSAGTATVIEVGSSLAGRIAAWGEVDHYRFEVGEAARVVVYTTGSTDTYGRLDSAASDDDAGDGSNFWIQASVGAGVHIVQVSGSGSVATGAYTLHVRRVLGPAAGETWSNALGMEFVGIPAGSFVMGSPEDEEDRDSRERQHEVRISQGFWMGKYEVTQGEWEAVMGSNPSEFDECGTRCPVDSVSWEDVQEYIRRLNERESGSGYEYRLPTEAEWEYAARAGTAGARHGELDEIAWHSGNSGLMAHPVGQKGANAWGLHDMLGNVWEWTANWVYAYPRGGAVTDPQGPDRGSYRVVRGGSWSNPAMFARSASRYSYRPSRRFKNFGFRLVRTE